MISVFLIGERSPVLPSVVRRGALVRQNSWFEHCESNLERSTPLRCEATSETDRR